MTRALMEDRELCKAGARSSPDRVQPSSLGLRSYIPRGGGQGVPKERERKKCFSITFASTSPSAASVSLQVRSLSTHPLGSYSLSTSSAPALDTKQQHSPCPQGVFSLKSHANKY